MQPILTLTSPAGASLRRLVSRSYKPFTDSCLCLLLLLSSLTARAQSSDGPFCNDYVVRNEKNANFHNGDINGIAVSGNRIYLPTGNDLRGNMIFSLDGGRTPFVNKDYLTVGSVPLYAKFTRVALKGETVYAIANGRLLVSFDRGFTFTDNFDGKRFEFLSDVKVVGDRVYIVGNTSSNPVGLQYSDDGIHFQRLGDIPHESRFSNGLIVTSPNPIVEMAIRDNLFCILFRGNSVAVSTNGGKSFHVVTLRGRDDIFFYGTSIFINPTTGNIYIGTSRGLFVTDDIERYAAFYGAGFDSNEISSVYAKGSTVYIGTRRGLNTARDVSGGVLKYFGSVPRFTNCQITGITVEANKLYVAYQGEQGGYGGYGYCPNIIVRGPSERVPLSLQGVEALNCEVLSDTSRRISFSPLYAGRDTTQPVSFSVAGELSPTTAPGPHMLRLWGDNPTITLEAQQGDSRTRYAYSWLAGCQATSSAREASAEEVSQGMQVKLLGNPIGNHQIRVEVSGVEGQALDLTLTDINGRRLSGERIERSGNVQQIQLKVSPAWGGMLLLRISASSTTGASHQILKVIQGQ